MLITAILEGLALLALLVAVAVFSSMKLKKTSRRKTVAISLAVSILMIAGALVISLGSVLQEEANVNLHLPGSATLKARFWLKEHQDMQPDKSHVANNVRILQDGLQFYRTFGNSFPPEAKFRMEEYAKLPPKIDHVLSIAEEAQYYEAAKGVIEVIGALAADAAPAGDSATTTTVIAPNVAIEGGEGLD